MNAKEARQLSNKQSYVEHIRELMDSFICRAAKDGVCGLSFVAPDCDKMANEIISSLKEDGFTVSTKWRKVSGYDDMKFVYWISW